MPILQLLKNSLGEIKRTRFCYIFGTPGPHPGNGINGARVPPPPPRFLQPRYPAKNTRQRKIKEDPINGTYGSGNNSVLTAARPSAVSVGRMHATCVFLGPVDPTALPA